MCIAIYKPAGAWATKRQLRECYERNPHGAGYAWHDGETIWLKKGFFSWRSFWKAFKRDVTADTPAFMHFRIATSGKKDAEHCHPFLMEGGVLMHNGPCINYRSCKGDDERSDTRQFVEDFVDGLTSKQFERLKPMIESFAGTEKIAAMFTDGKVVICNEDYGHWKDGVWWSNHSYEERSFKSTSTTSADKSTAKELEWWETQTADGDDDPIMGIGTGMYPYRSFAADEIWSQTLKLRVKQKLTITDDTYVWDEKLSAYIMEKYKDDVTLFPLTDDGAVYGATDDTSVYTQVGHIVVDSQDYYDLYYMSDERFHSAANA